MPVCVIFDWISYSCFPYFLFELKHLIVGTKSRFFFQSSDYSSCCFPVSPYYYLLQQWLKEEVEFRHIIRTISLDLTFGWNRNCLLLTSILYSHFVYCKILGSFHKLLEACQTFVKVKFINHVSNIWVVTKNGTLTSTNISSIP